MVYMTHHRHNWSAIQQIVLVVLLFSDSVLHLCTDIFGRKAELLSHDIDGLGIQTLVDTHHDTNRHTGTDDLVHADIHHGSEL